MEIATLILALADCQFQANELLRADAGKSRATLVDVEGWINENKKLFEEGLREIIREEIHKASESSR